MKEILLLLIVGLTSCASRTEKFSIRQNAIDHMHDLELIKDMILNNISLLEDSCCQNNNTCNYPDSVKATFFYPATYFLLEKYLPEKEKSSLKVLKKLSPSGMRNSSDNIIISDLSFRPDSTIVFPVAEYKISDTIINHKIIFSPEGNKSRRYASNNNVYKTVNFAPGWKYYILWSVDEGW